MSEQVKEALNDLALAVIKGLKILVVYIIPATIAAMLISPEFSGFVQNRPELVAYVPLINFGSVMIADMIKRWLPENPISKVL